MKEKTKPKYTLDRSSGKTLQQLLSEHLWQRKMAGEFKESNKLPTLQNIREDYGVSLSPIKGAIDILKKANRVESWQGKRISIKELSSIPFETICLKGFTRLFKEKGIATSSRVVQKILLSADNSEQIPEITEISQKLELKAGDSIIKIKRVRLADNTPVALQTAYLPYRFCPGLQNEDFETQSLYELLETKYHKQIDKGRHIVRVKNINKTDSGFLDLKPKTLGFFIERFTYEKNQDKPFEYTIDIRDVRWAIEIILYWNQKLCSF